MKRVLILGVNGFIGHHLSKRIIAATDWDIYGMDMQTDRIADLLSEPRYGTMAFMLMIILGRIGRRLEAQPETNP